MKSRWILCWLLLCATASVTASALADELGVISGVVRDVEGKPIRGAIVSLASGQAPALVTQTVS
ncbi:MAG: hypothetical protein WBY73_17140, partial [Candidatus Acidiferrales bacterium]